MQKPLQHSGVRRVFWRHLKVGAASNIKLSFLPFFVIFFGFYPVPLIETFSVSVYSLIDNYEIALKSSERLKEWDSRYSNAINSLESKMKNLIQEIN